MMIEDKSPDCDGEAAQHAPLDEPSADRSIEPRNSQFQMLGLPRSYQPDPQTLVRQQVQVDPRIAIVWHARS